MRRHTLALLAGATLLIGGAGTGTALAQEADPPPTGPGTAACVEARAALDSALVSVDASVGLRGDADLDAVSDRLAEIGTGTEGVTEALALVGDARSACTPPADEPGDGDQGDGGDVTPTPTPEPGDGDDNGQDGPTPGDSCSTDEIPSGIVGGDGECIGATGGPEPGQSSDGGPVTGGSTGGQVGTVPQGYADTGAL
ncbi:hypothetical protein [Pseudonocardia sp. McavD-2-B]|uniref:hypothetical protein n=1 Tax=Pseudonocardia sp. McavD-2-B TaxID=2954499 RepID=UPI0020971B59|nr:hypothetical protein [Pseudonocardia sp. McavD-2-B]MCO7195055.1 hypothetical protein [Pseudonocardia sp. McavD-2-B]